MLIESHRECWIARSVEIVGQKRLERFRGGV
jgi:hypothetical protein